jgi:hypothetical protein
MDWKSVVGTVAPWLATALGGPLAGEAVQVIGNALGLSEKTEATIKNALAGLTPEQMLAIKQADNEFALRMQQAGFANVEAMEALHVQDVSSARDRQVQTKDSTNTVLAYTVVGSFIAMVGTTLLGYSSIDSALAGTLVGYLSAKAEQVMSYYFGSSKGSDRKTELLAQSTPPDPKDRV